ncbi:MAG: hypothetical protein QM733_03765 [Ilumatobacteraceae bacterium]
MKLLRRALGALALAGAIGAAMRTRGRGGVPPQEGGWREVPPPASGGATAPSPPSP